MGAEKADGELRPKTLLAAVKRGDLKFEDLLGKVRNNPQLAVRMADPECIELQELSNGSGYCVAHEMAVYCRMAGYMMLNNEEESARHRKLLDRKNGDGKTVRQLIEERMQEASKTTAATLPFSALMRKEAAANGRRVKA
jgi:hypothetical protein